MAVPSFSSKPPAKPFNTTVGMSTEWVMEVFDWDDKYPKSPSELSKLTEIGKTGIVTELGNLIGAGGTNQSAYLNGSLITSLSGNSHKIREMVPAFKTKQDNLNMADLVNNYDPDNSNNGLVSLSFSRNKNSINSPAKALVVGPLPKGTRAGNWVLISSLYIEGGGAKSKCSPRYIGQITSISTTQSINPDGTITTVNNINIKEWSSLLLTPVRFDVRSITSVAQVNKLAGVATSLKSNSDFSGKTQYDTIIEALGNSLDPYSAAINYLQLVGLINTSGYSATGGVNETYKIAIGLPAIPSELIERINMDDYVKSESAFVDGFVKVFAGRQLQGVYNTGYWDGIFDKEFKPTLTKPRMSLSANIKLGVTTDSDSMSLNDYSEAHKVPSNEPENVQQGVIQQLGDVSVWDMVSQYCDPDLNEAYTDLLYERQRDGTLYVQPAIFMRGKPFKTKAAEGSFETKFKPTALYETWAYYESVPRVRIKDGTIMALSCENTILSSPNYIRTSFNSGVGNLYNAEAEKVGSMLALRMGAEMSRFGPNTSTIKSQYILYGEEVDWSMTKIQLGSVWNSFNYRTAHGTLTIKDDTSSSFSVGFNVQFRYGANDFVAQIESIFTQFSVYPSGIKSTVTSIEFSRLMVVSDSNAVELLFIEPEYFGNLMRMPTVGMSTPPIAPIMQKQDSGLKMGSFDKSNNL